MWYIKHNIYSDSIDFIQILGVYVHFYWRIAIKRLHTMEWQHISIAFIKTTYEHPINHYLWPNIHQAKRERERVCSRAPTLKMWSIKHNIYFNSIASIQILGVFWCIFIDESQIKTLHTKARQTYKHCLHKHHIWTLGDVVFPSN